MQPMNPVIDDKPPVAVAVAKAGKNSVREGGSGADMK
jgi:hypothetical protein